MGQFAEEKEIRQEVLNGNINKGGERIMNIEDRLLTISPYCRSGEKQNKIEKIVVHWVRQCRKLSGWK